jgi:hypothetical protein
VTTDSEDARQRLIEIEARMRALSPVEDAYWKLEPERRRLRAAIDVLWLDSHRFGTRVERWAPLPWPDDVKERWRVLREFIEAYKGVPLGDIAKKTYAGGLRAKLAREARALRLGESVSQWMWLLDQLQKSKQWGWVFRDALSFSEVPDADEPHVSIMVQGENDYHWAVRCADLEAEDPRVFAFKLNYKDRCFQPDWVPERYGPYGSYASVTDFVRSMLTAYLRPPLGVALHRLAAAAPQGYVWADSTVPHYGDSLPGVWSAPLGRRIPPTNDLPADLRAAVVEYFAPNAPPAEDALLAEVLEEGEDEIHDLALMVGSDIGMHGLKLRVNPSTLTELFSMVEHIARGEPPPKR